MSLLARLAVIVALLLPVAAQGQTPSFTYVSPSGNGHDYVPWTGSVNSAPAFTTYQGTLTVTGAASGVAISTLSLNSGSGAFPTGALGNVFILNSGSGTAYICWFIATATSCTASGGSFPLVAGASVTKNLGASTVVPSVFSTAGTTLAITN